MLYGLTPSVPLMPSHTTPMGIQVEANKMRTHNGGAVARLSLNFVFGMRIGQRMKKMDMTKKISVTMDFAS